MVQTNSTIEVEGVHKHFGDVHALAGLSMSVGQGELVGVLGPNGAGKTTLINVLATLVRPDSGTCKVGGVDVVQDPVAVRSMIGLTGQFAAIDDVLTARENLVLFARLLKLGRKQSPKRADELLERFDLVEAADRRVGGFSGGMRRRLDLAVSMLAQPTVLFLDEPTTGLDPRSRHTLWDVVRELKEQGVTIVLTTQYLEEADQLADRIVVIDGGKVIAEGAGKELKAQVGSSVVEITFDSAQDTKHAVQVLGGDAEETAGMVSVPAQTPADVLRITGRVGDLGFAISDISIRQPTLDDVFLALTEKRPAGAAPGDSAEEQS